MDPFIELVKSQAMARERMDPNSHTCVLATVGKNGRPTVRTMATHRIDRRSIRLLFSSQSVKSEQLRETGEFEILIFWPLVHRQYRLAGHHEGLSEDCLDRAWDAMCGEHKLIEHYYSVRRSLGSPLRSLVEFNRELDALQQSAGTPSSLPRPDHFAGADFEITRMEALHIRENRRHERHTYSYIEGSWQHYLSVP